MEEFIEFATAIDAAFRSRIEGASAEEIQRIGRFAGVPLPLDYRLFLEWMGHEDDGIVASGELDTSAAAIIGFHENKEGVVPPDSIVLGLGNASIEMVCIDVAPPHRVWETFGGKRTALWAGSLRGMLYKNMFMRATFRGYAHVLNLSTGQREPRLQRCATFARDLGMERLWFSDDVTVCYASHDEAIVADQPEGGGLFVRLATQRTTRRLEELSAALQSALRVQLSIAKMM